ncbi:tripartite tricarboxylate transporter substrate binding protein [Acidovorax sp. ACV01]|uniref:Bug family tripartite tricarboxylate transporter substrate binding protein n=1 Tax=Acidovorax sp. ACV01 TaxID=2769311 RepID=UPI001785F60E|nr:tripartite tricarboxylate transporter substrate binding protein [Acidovorax sp. ACV01]MBD9394095.1 tripartite tricarboxylate transporter substrate binding protein [Acidovorax sp. ACV01]
MPYTRRGALSALILAMGLPFAAMAQSTAADQAIKLVVPWPPGGSADALGRQIALALSAGLGQNVYVENVAGASGNIGTANALRAAPDGRTLLLATSTTNSAGPSLFTKLPFHPVNDFVPISLAAVAPSVLIVSATSPYKSVKDIVDAAKAKPGQLTYGSGGNGNSGHLSAALFASTFGFQAMHVPYKGNTPATIDLLGGQIDFMFDNNPVGMVKGGKARALATTGDQRTAALPEVPTFKELGWPAVNLTTWFGLAAPKGTPPAVAERVHAALVDGLKKIDANKRLQELGFEVKTQSPADFQVFWNAELERYRGLVKLSGAKVE